MEKIKHIFFDLDNTLWDYRKNALTTLERLFVEYQIEEKFGHDFKSFYDHYYEVNEMLWDGFRDGEITRAELQERRFPETFANMGIQNVDFSMELEKRFMNEVTDTHHLVDGTEEVLNHLKGKYRLHILSNGFKEITHQKINGSLIKDFVETITTAEDAGVAKPHPKAFQTAIDQSDATAENSIYIGDDWIADMVGATRFGMKAIFFNPLNENHLWIEDVPVIDHLIELKEYL